MHPTTPIPIALTPILSIVEVLSLTPIGEDHHAHPDSLVINTVKPRDIPMAFEWSGFNISFCQSNINETISILFSKRSVASVEEDVSKCKRLRVNEERILLPYYLPVRAPRGHLFYITSSNSGGDMRTKTQHSPPVDHENDVFV